MRATLLTVQVDSKRWPSGQQVLGHIHFSMSVGEVVAISGPSGCGKSTLMSLLAGLDRDYDGRLEWIGTPRLGVVFQTPRLLPWRTAIENVALGLSRERNVGELARAALAEVGLAEAADVYPSKLSLGMAQRVAIARALIAEPEVVLLDEAFASLDEGVAEKLRASIMTRVAARRMSVVMVTHAPRDSAEMADRLLVLGGTPTRLIAERSLRPSPGPHLRKQAIPPT